MTPKEMIDQVEQMMYKEAGKCRYTSVSMEDLVQEARLRILERYEDYDPEKGKVSTFAYYIIRSAMQNYVAHTSRPLKGSRLHWRMTKVMDTGGEEELRRQFPQLKDPVKLVENYQQFTSLEGVDVPAPEEMDEGFHGMIEKYLHRLYFIEAVAVRGYYLEGKMFKDLGEGLGICPRRLSDIAAEGLRKMALLARIDGVMPTDIETITND